MIRENPARLAVLLLAGILLGKWGVEKLLGSFPTKVALKPPTEITCTAEKLGGGLAIHYSLPPDSGQCVIYRFMDCGYDAMWATENARPTPTPTPTEDK